MLASQTTTYDQKGMKEIQNKNAFNRNLIAQDHLSASSKIIILCLPGGNVTFFWANIFILFLTTSIPLDKNV